ncbi:MAG TPA: xanthine dehydrogenase family protein molybdopterin-binding subunit [Acidobacteriaceae bacterium]|nr:xanthine dehydrogenase family protein molybdopterin-binding subunit [Acidobacteriaceae bacterium]
MSASIIGAAVNRIDGPLKVSGAAEYAVDHRLENLAYGVGVASTVGNARVVRVEASEAERMPGVLAVLWHGNTPPLYRPAERLEHSRAGEIRPPFEDDQVYYYGQFVALAIASTLEQAQAAADKVKVEYDVRKPAVLLSEAPAPQGPPRVHSSRGDAVGAFAGAAVKLDETYTVPVEVHNPMEMHATIAKWDGDKLTVYATTQGVLNEQKVLAEVMGIPLEDVKVISPFCGSGFGGKLFPWPQSMLAALGAKHVKRPVEVQVPRSLMFTTVGHRPLTRQRMRIGATADGQLVSMQHDVVQSTSMVDEYVEYCTGVTTTLYDCPNVETNQQLVRLNVGTPTPMRGPGAVPGLVALESAMNELAAKLEMDPIALRLKNYAETDPGSHLPWSSKHLRECYQTGAERFGWAKRTPKVGSMRQGNEILGWGMASAIWDAGRGGATVRVRLNSNGTARASCATQDIGTGTYTIFAQVVSEKTGIPLDKVQVVLGDSTLPPGPTSGGSTVTATVLPAIAKATDQAIQRLLEAAVMTPGSPYFSEDRANAPKVAMTRGWVHEVGSPYNSGVPFDEILIARRLAALDGEAKTEPDMADRERYSFRSFGAQFMEVAWDPGIARLRVSRALTVIDAGNIINKKAGTNQILGAVVMGIGMAMFEEAIYDPRTGKPINSNFADYLVATNADVPKLECVFLEYPDYHLNEYGARGIGEIGLAGVAPALTMAIYHATGVRVRKLPCRIEDILGGETATIA